MSRHRECRGLPFLFVGLAIGALIGFSLGLAHYCWWLVRGRAR